MTAIRLRHLAFMLSFGATACFAQTAPSILDINLGMTPAQVLPLAKTHAAEKRAQVQTHNVALSARDPARSKPFPIPNGAVTLSVSTGVANMNILGSDKDDELAVHFVPVPGKEVAGAIYRRVGYRDGSGPSNENMVKELARKYGVPSAVAERNPRASGQELLWAYDSSGKLLKNVDLFKCIPDFPEPNHHNFTPTAPNSPWDQVFQAPGKSAEQFYTMCGVRQLRVGYGLDGQGISVNRMKFRLLDVKAVIDGQAVANQLMRTAFEAAVGRAARNASELKPKL